MDLESVKRYLEKGDDVKEEEEEEIQENKITIHELPSQFYERFVMEGIKLDLIECGRIICSFNVSPRLLNGSKILHGGVVATMVDLVGSSVTPTCGALNTGVSVEINVSFMDAVYENKKIPSDDDAGLINEVMPPILQFENNRKRRTTYQRCVLIDLKRRMQFAATSS